MLLAMACGALYPFVGDPALLPAAGFAPTVPIYLLVAALLAISIPDQDTAFCRRRPQRVRRGRHGASRCHRGPPVSAHGAGGGLALMIGLLDALVLAVVMLGIETRHPVPEVIA